MRAPVSQTLVLEKHADFLRDFRGDTLHPSTLEVLGELGLLEALLELPHDRVAEIAAQFGDTALKIADFRHLPTRCGFIAMMPQWDFLNFLAKQGARYPAIPVAHECGSDRLAGRRAEDLGESKSGTRTSPPTW